MNTWGHALQCIGKKECLAKYLGSGPPSPTAHLALPYVAMSFLENIHAQVNVPQ